MELILGLMKYFWGIVLCLSVTLLVWDKFFKAAEGTVEVDQMQVDGEESMEAVYTAD